MEQRLTTVVPIQVRLKIFTFQSIFIFGPNFGKLLFRVKDNVFIWLQWMAIILGILLALILIFTCCWSAKRRHVDRNRNGKRRNIVLRPPPPLIRPEKSNTEVSLRFVINHQCNHLTTHSNSSSSCNCSFRSNRSTAY
jgi:hypothetical protein